MKMLTFSRFSLSALLSGVVLSCGPAINANAQQPVPVFVTLARNTPLGNPPTAITMAPYGNGWNFSAAAPVTGSTWNNIFRATQTPADTGTYTPEAPFILDSMNNVPLYAADGTPSPVRLTAGLIGTHARKEPGDLSAGSAQNAKELLNAAWRIYAADTAMHMRVSFSGLAPNTHYYLYFYGNTNAGGVGQGGRYILHPSNFPASSTSTFLYPGLTPEENLPTSFVDLAGFNTALSLFRQDENGDATIIPPARATTPSASRTENTIWGALHAVSTADGQIAFRTASNAWGTRFYSGFQLIPYPAPTISEQPDADMVGVLDQITEFFSVAKDMPHLHDADQNPLVYQWQVSKDNGSTWTDIPVVAPGTAGERFYTSQIREPALPTDPNIPPEPASKITSVLAINGTQQADAGRYRLKVTNVAGGVTTSSASTLSVIAQPAPFLITQQPQPRDTVVGNETSLSVAVSGTPPFSFTWQKSDTADFATFTTVKTSPRGPATSDTLAFPFVRRSDLGFYRAVITDVTRRNPIYSDVVYVYVEYAPPIITPPGSQTVSPGGAISLFGNVYSEIPVTAYRWEVSRDNGATWTAVVDGGAYSGATTETLRISSAGTTEGGRYRLVATNALGTTTGAAIPLAVAAPLIAHPVGVAVDEAGHLYVTDDSANAVYQFTLGSGSAVLFAGQSGVSGSANGYYGQATFNAPTGAVSGAANTVFLADTFNATVRSLQANGLVGTIAGSASVRDNIDGTGAAASFNAPVSTALDAAGNIYVADNVAHTIRRITPLTFDVTTLAGTAGASGSVNATTTNSSYNPATRFNAPGGIAVSPVNLVTNAAPVFETPTTTATTLYVADTGNNVIRKIALTWYLDRDPITNVQTRTRLSRSEVTTLAGLAGASGSANGAGADARFNAPSGVAVDDTGAIYVADTGNHTIRKIVIADTAVTVTTIGGLPGVSGYQDGPNANNSLFNQPRAVTVDTAGNVYVADTGNAAVRKISPNGTVSTLIVTRGTDPVPPANPGGSGSSPAPDIPPAGSGDRGGDLGGGGAPSLWFFAATALAALFRARKHFMKNVSLFLIAVLAGVFALQPAARAQNPAVFINLSTTQAVSGAAPTAAATVTIAPPGSGWSFGAVAPYAGETWNNILAPHADDEVKPSLKGYVRYQIVPLNTANNIAVFQPDGSASGVTFTAAAILDDANTATNNREVPRRVSPTGGTPSAMLNSSWRIFEGGNLIGFTFSGLPANAHYVVYGYGTTNGVNQGARVSLVDANAVGAKWFDTNPAANTAPTLFALNAGTLSPVPPAPLEIASNAAGGANSNTVWGVLHAKVDSAGKIEVRAARNANNNGYINGLQLIPYPKATITTQPSANASGTIGDSVTLTVATTGFDASDVVTYQWRKAGVAINAASNPSAATASLTLSNLQNADADNYDVVVTNYGGDTISSATVLTVTSGAVAPSITTQPVAQTAVTGGNVAFSVGANGTSPLTYTWEKSTTSATTGFTDVPSSNSATLSLTGVTVTDAGFYRVRVQNSVGTITSDAASLIVAPVITAQPLGATVTEGSTTTITAVIDAGTGAPEATTYVWKRDGVVVTEGAGISGATSSSLQVTGFSAAHSGYYTLTASNSAGAITTATVYVGVPSTQSVTFAPGNNATGVNPDAPLIVRFPSAPRVGEAGKITVRKTSDDSVVETIDLATLTPFTNASVSYRYQTGKIVGGQAGYKYFPVLIVGNEARITLRSGSVLQYGTSYYVTIDPGVILDSTGATLPAVTNSTGWTFATKAAAPAAIPTQTTFTVAADGSGDFSTLQGALDFIPTSNATPVRINIRNGTYTELVNFGNRNKITVVGENRDLTVVEYPNNAPLNSDTTLRVAFFARGSDLVFANFSINNSTPKGGGQAEALRSDGLRNSFLGCAFRSFQDTLLLGADNYFQDCLIQGDTDFIWGGGTAMFKNCELRAMNGGELTQARTPATRFGFIFVDCTLTRPAGSSFNYGLGRTSADATNFGNPVFIDSRMDTHITATAWSSSFINSSYTANARNWEYQSRTLDGSALIDVSQRAAISRQLTSTEADILRNPANAFGTTTDSTPAGAQGNGWVPAVSAIIHTQPLTQSVNAGQPVSLSVFANAAPAPTYQWYKNAVLIPGATAGTYSIASAGAADVADYTVVLTNASGAVTSATATITVSGITATPVFTTHPNSQTAFLGASVTLTAAATGSPTYQWKKDGNDIADAVSASYTIANATAGSAGSYTVVATNSAGSTTSNAAALTVADPAGPAVVADGYASAVTGGAGGATYVVTTAADLNARLQLAGPAIITVSGTIDVRSLNSGKRVDVTSNKTLQGADANATILGTVNIDGVQNVIVRGLNITNPGTTLENGTGPRYSDGGDGITIRNSNGVLVTHCTFYDCADGMCDLTYDVANATVSWCKFYYTTAQTSHRFTMILGNEATVVPITATLHHNWWSDRCDQRMPASSNARGHMFNNYFTCAGNSYSSNARDNSQLFIEQSYYGTGVKDPVTKSTGTSALIRTIGNIYSGTSGQQDPGTDVVFTPPYSYAFTPASGVPALVSIHAGNTAGAFSTTPAAAAALAINGAPAVVYPGNNITLTPSVSDGTSFQWRLNNLEISGATSETLTLTNIQASQIGVYTVVVGNASGGFTVSSPVTLQAGAAPIVGTTGGPVSVVAGRNVSIRASVTGEQLSFRWQRLVDGSWVNLTEGQGISGSATDTLTVSDAAGTHAGEYRFVVTNPSGSATSSSYVLGVAPAHFPNPTGVAVDAFGELYVADSSLNIVRKIASGGAAKLHAGLPNTAGFADGVLGRGSLNAPGNLSIDAFGNLYVADAGNATVRAISREGTITTLAGDPIQRGSRDGIGTAALFTSPAGPSFDRTNGVTYVADTNNHTIRRLTPQGLQVGLFAGNVVATISGAAGMSGDADVNTVPQPLPTGTARPDATLARYNHPSSVAFTGTYLYVADTGNNTIRRISLASGDNQFTTATLAGTPGITGSDDGTGLDALFNKPQAIVADASGAVLYVADTGNNAIRRVTSAGVVTTLAGLPGIAGMADGVGEDALFNRPSALALNVEGTVLYVADTGNSSIRRIAISGSTGTVTTVAITSVDDTVPPVNGGGSPSAPFVPTGDSAGQGGGGSPSVWFLAALGALALVRSLRARRATA